MRLEWVIFFHTHKQVLILRSDSLSTPCNKQSTHKTNIIKIIVHKNIFIPHLPDPIVDLILHKTDSLMCENAYIRNYSGVQNKVSWSLKNIFIKAQPTCVKENLQSEFRP